MKKKSFQIRKSFVMNDTVNYDFSVSNSLEHKNISGVGSKFKNMAHFGQLLAHTHQ